MIQIDTLNIHPQDSAIVPVEPVVNQNSDTHQVFVPIKRATQPVSTVKKQQSAENQQVNTKELAESHLNNDSIIFDSIINQEYIPYTLFPNLNQKDSSVYNAKSGNFDKGWSINTFTEYALKPRHVVNKIEKDWVFGIAVFLTVLILIIRIYFQKQLTVIISSALNFQLADKLMREKNIIVRRVFTLLNLNFIISFSLYAYILLKRGAFEVLKISDFQLFILITGIIITILIVRLVLLNFIGNVFNSLPVIKEYIHNTYILNKNLGLYLLPFILSVFYLQQTLSDISFYVATILVIASFLYRYLRGLQIIMKYKVLYFYTILYLCTLEILPALVGFKFVLSLR